METIAIWAFVLLTMAAPTAAVWGNWEKEYRGGCERSGALVHLMEWSYKDIQNECDSLDWNGYYGIIISPPVEHVEIKDNPDWKERYMPISLKTFTTRSGTEDELRDMLSRCAKWNRLRVFVDLNLNNMLKATEKDVVGFAGTKANPSEYKYEGIGQEQFHDPCDLTPLAMHSVEQVRVCQVDGLQDLDNKNPVLKSAHVKMMNRLVDMGIFGFRIVMARHMYPDHLSNIYQDLHNTFLKNKPLIIHDVNDLDDCVIKSADYSHVGMVTDYKYGAELYKYFSGKPDRSLRKLLLWGNVKLKENPKPRGKEPLVFLYNHENQYEKDILKPTHGKAYSMALAFMMAFPYGIPMVLSTYSGKSSPKKLDGTTASPRPSNVRDNSYYYECTNNFACEHRVDTTIMMSLFKAEVRETELSWLQENEQEQWFAFARGDRGFIYFNAGTTSQKRRFENLPLKAGKYCDLATGEIVDYGTRCTGKVITIEGDKSTTITLNEDDPYGYVAIMTRAWLDPKKVAVGKVYNYNAVSRWVLGVPAKLFRFVANAALEAGAKMTETHNNPDAGILQTVGAGVGAVGNKLFTNMADVIEGVGRRAVTAVQTKVVNAAQNAVEGHVVKQLEVAQEAVGAELQKQMKEAIESYNKAMETHDVPSLSSVDAHEETIPSS